MPVTIIAEAGVNHNGDLETAKRMAYVAKECGADIVKYQTAVPELVVSRFAEKAEYQKQTTDAAESQLEMIRKLHFSFEGHRELKEYCDSIGIQYLSAPFDIPSVRFLGTLGMPLIKIPSGEITNLPYLEEIGKLHTPALLSTGMCNLSEITDALGILDDNGCPEVTILHCNTQYPTPYEDANLTAMLELFDQFGLPGDGDQRLLKPVGAARGGHAQHLGRLGVEHLRDALGEVRQPAGDFLDQAQKDPLGRGGPTA